MPTVSDPTASDVIAAAIPRLSPITETPRLDAEILLAHALGITRASLLARLREPIQRNPSTRISLSPPPASSLSAVPTSSSPHSVPASSSPHSVPTSSSPQAVPPSSSPQAVPPSSSPQAVSGDLSFTEVFANLLSRREQSEPLGYILGEWEFFSLPFFTQAPILVPRPETEHLVEVVLDFLNGNAATVCEPCTGSGCIAVSIARNSPETRVCATDTSSQAIALAQRNIQRHGVQDRVTLQLGDLLEPYESARQFDVVCANPPYVATGDWDALSPTIRNYEDPAALLAGDDGLDLIRRLVADAPRVLRPDGLLAFEIGMGQDEAVRALLNQHGYRDIGFRPDLAGIPRIAMAFCP